MKAKQLKKIHPDWWSKTFAGALLGLSFSVAVGCCIALLGFSTIDRGLAAQLGMWAVPWIWCPLFFLAFFFHRGWHVLVVYSVLNLLAYGCFFWFRG
ncbi:hypothetical protein [Acinetobacter larvae]|uniref:Uncharacterized protein n=1 Tax=Acinetobacter larvae TaxID=1789224 RepID=A0A1B2LVT5_9GAMM|nr:hypothetical protein [Acinetobacter larvae]AOA57024.1 hypothetical protein BFG52_00725 [Acinetobacter larvae]